MLNDILIIGVSDKKADEVANRDEIVLSICHKKIKKGKRKQVLKKVNETLKEAKLPNLTDGQHLSYVLRDARKFKKARQRSQRQCRQSSKKAKAQQSLHKVIFGNTKQNWQGCCLQLAVFLWVYAGGRAGESLLVL